MKALPRIARVLTLIGFLCPFPVMAKTLSNSNNSSIAMKDQQNAHYLFVLRAEKGVITKTESGYTLTLQNLDDKVLYFSDRPIRKAGFILIPQFMSSWSKGHNSSKANPPNAAMLHTDLKADKNGVAKADVFELSDPQQENNGWSFHINTLKGKSVTEGTYNGVSIFVDSACGIVPGFGGPCFPSGKMPILS